MAGAAETEGASTRPRVFVPEELAVHNSRDNCWVAVNHKVIDVTPVIASLPAEHAALADPLLDNAGTDISHWFDEVTKQVKTFIDELRHASTCRGNCPKVWTIRLNTTKSRKGTCWITPSAGKHKTANKHFGPPKRRQFA